MADALNIVLVGPEAGMEEAAWSVYSPQLPGFTGGSESLDALKRELPGMLTFAGVDPATPRRAHQEIQFSAPEADFMIRLETDRHRDERVHTSERVQAALKIETQRREMLDAPRTVTGEVLFICAVPSDTVRSIAEQLDATGEAAVIVCCVAEQLIWATHFAVGEGMLPEGHPLDYFGWSMDMTIAELMESQAISNRPREVLLSA